LPTSWNRRDQRAMVGRGWRQSAKNVSGGRLLLPRKTVESQVRVKELLQQAAMVGYGSLQHSSLVGKVVAAERAFQREGGHGAASWPTNHVEATRDHEMATEELHNLEPSAWPLGESSR
jgi:hypothetical protein